MEKFLSQLQNNKLKIVGFICISIATFSLDIFFKEVMEANFELHESMPLIPFFQLTLVYNYGSAFSFLSNAGGWQVYFLSIIAIIAIFIFLVWLVLSIDKKSIFLSLGLSLIIGGAAGNLVDRIMDTRVTDYFDFYINTWHYPIFNLADVFIISGFIGVLLDSWFFKDRKKDEV